MTERLKSVWQGSFKIGNAEIKAHVLNNGQRVIDADDFEKIFESLSDNPSDYTDLLKWMEEGDQ